MITYKPKRLVKPKLKLDVVSAWAGLEEIIPDIIEQFDLQTKRCIEFGVEFGYSAVALSNYFEEVWGFDTFEGDQHTAHKGNHYEQTKESLSKYRNIFLTKESYQVITGLQHDHPHKPGKFVYDMAHVDIVHTYKDTYACGLWCAQHSQCVIFHDTESFPDVKRAVIDIAAATGKTAYNYPKHYGLGIIV